MSEQNEWRNKIHALAFLQPQLSLYLVTPDSWHLCGYCKHDTVIYIYYCYAHVQQFLVVQESCAIAKMTARCAL